MCRPQGRVETCNCSNDQWSPEASGDDVPRNSDGPSVCETHSPCDRRANHTSHASAKEGEEQGLGKELHADMSPFGSQGTSKPDFAATFKDGDDHCICDPDPANQQGDRANTCQKGCQSLIGCILCSQRIRWT